MPRVVANLAVTAAVIAFASAGMSSGCRPTNGQDEPAADSPGAMKQTASDSIPVVIFEPEGKPRAAVTVEIVRERADIQRGLMFRRSMPDDHGMLFLMGEERIHSFWMRNTYIPLDMIFIAKDMTVAGIVENTTPLTDTSRYVNRMSYYVLEVNAGWSSKHHVTADTRVRFRDVDE